VTCSNLVFETIIAGGFHVLPSPTRTVPVQCLHTDHGRLNCIQSNVQGNGTSWRYRRLGGPRIRSGRYRKGKILYPAGTRTPTSLSSSSYSARTDCFIPSPISVIITVVIYEYIGLKYSILVVCSDLSVAVVFVVVIIIFIIMVVLPHI
jgi:hypothetical protein